MKAPVTFGGDHTHPQQANLITQRQRIKESGNPKREARGVLRGAKKTWRIGLDSRFNAGCLAFSGSTPAEKKYLDSFLEVGGVHRDPHRS